MQSKWLLVLAVGGGILAFVAAKVYFDYLQAESQRQFRGEPVVAAKVNIPRGAELKLEMLMPKEVPRAFIPAQAVRGSQELKEILGSKTAVPLKPGQIILWADLASERTGGLATVIPEGEKAFTIEIAKGIQANLLQPNDHIDILATFAMPKDGSDKELDMVNCVLLQNVTVLAIGNYHGSGNRGGSSEGRSITVAVTPVEAQLLMFASEHGELGSVLRRDNDVAVLPPEELPKVTFADIERLVGNVDQQRQKRFILLQKGNVMSSVPVER